MADKTISMTAATATSIDRTDLLARLRVELHDEDSNNYRWTDATLQRHLERAVREVSQAWPRERLTVLTATASSRDIDVSAEFADLVRIEAVEWPIDQEPRRYIQWSLYQTTLTLLDENIPSAADSVNVYWGSRHLVDNAQSTLPQVTEEAVVQGAAGYAAVEWANYAIQPGEHRRRGRAAGVPALGGGAAGALRGGAAGVRQAVPGARERAVQGGGRAARPATSCGSTPDGGTLPWWRWC